VKKRKAKKRHDSEKDQNREDDIPGLNKLSRPIQTIAIHKI